MHGLNSRIVKQRVLRRHYGIATSVAWNNERHPLERRWKDKLDGTWRVDVMRWYAKKVSIWPITGTNWTRDNESKITPELRWSCITTLTTASCLYGNVSFLHVTIMWLLCILMTQVLPYFNLF